MTVRYENELSKHLLANKKFTEKFNKAVITLYENQPEVALTNDKVEAKIIRDKEHKVAYLLVKRDDGYEVYTEQYNSKFDYELKALKDKDGSIYSEKIAIISLDNEEVFDLDQLDKIGDNLKDEDLKAHTDKIMKALTQMRKKMNGKEAGYGSNVYALNNFLEFLVEQKALKSFNNEVLLENPTLNAILDTRIEEIGLVSNFLLKAMKDHSYTNKNKYTFNDLDNHVWKQGQYLMLDNQNCSYAVDYKDENNFEVYGVAHSHNSKAKKFSSIAPMLADIKANGANYLDHSVLSVKDGKTQYVDNTLISNFDMHLMFAKDEALDDKLGVISYPVDIRDFDYQLAYSMSRYGNTKESFLMHALFVLGNGFNYDSSTGRLFDYNIVYNPSIMKDFKEPEWDQERITNISYFYPKEGLSNLDEKWTKALEHLVNKIKINKPDTSKSYTPQGKTVEQVLEYLDSIVKSNKQRLGIDTGPEPLFNKVTSQTDVKDYDYQFAYMNRMLALNKTQFLTIAVFTLGSGFIYDENKGTIYSPEVMEDSSLQNYRLYDQKEEKVTTIDNLYPVMKLTKLDEKWTQALQDFVDKIKTDKPTSKTKNVEEFVASLEEVIKNNKPKVVKLKQ